MMLLQEEVERHNKRLAEAEAAQEARKKPQEEKAAPRGNLGEGLVIDEWVRVTVIQSTWTILFAPS
jgi:hypothetical protein